MMNAPTINDDNSGLILDTEIESHKKSFLIRDILEPSTQNNLNNHSNNNAVLLPTNERLISWILQNRDQVCLDQNQEHESDTDSLSPILNEITKYSMFIQKEASSLGTISDSWLNLSNQVANITNPLAFYQHLYYYALQNQLNSIETLNNHLDKNDNIEVTNNSSNEVKNIKNIKKTKNNSKNHNNKANKKDKTTVPNLSPSSVSSSSSSDLSTAIPLSTCTLTTSTTPTLTISTSTTVLGSSLSSSSGRNRRNRTVFSELQLMGLERRFDSQKYLSTPDRSDLARALGLTQLQVKTWYQNRRMKWKKQVMQNGCPFPPTKPKGRPKKDSIPTYGIEFTNSILCSIFAKNNNNPDEQLDTIHVQD